MNKLLIVLLAVCLVSVHGFVKRDAPAPATADADNSFEKTIAELSKTWSQNMQKVFDPETVKEKINGLAKDLIKAVDNAAASIKPKPSV